MKLNDLMLSSTDDYGLKEIAILQSQRIIALDGYNGKILFDTRKNNEEFIKRFMNAEVIAIWASAKEKFVDSGFMGTYFEPCTMMYLSHDSWKEQKNE